MDIYDYLNQNQGESDTGAEQDYYKPEENIMYTQGFNNSLQDDDIQLEQTIQPEEQQVVETNQETNQEIVEEELAEEEQPTEEDNQKESNQEEDYNAELSSEDQEEYDSLFEDNDDDVNDFIFGTSDLAGYGQKFKEQAYSNSGTYRDRIAYKESRGKYDALNPVTGASGKYQFMPMHFDKIRQVTGVKSMEEFRKSPLAQEAFFEWWDANELTPMAAKLQKQYSYIPNDNLKELVHFQGYPRAVKYLNGSLSNTPEGKGNMPIDQYTNIKIKRQTGGETEYAQGGINWTSSYNTNFDDIWSATDNVGMPGTYAQGNNGGLLDNRPVTLLPSGFTPSVQGVPPQLQNLPKVLPPQPLTTEKEQDKLNFGQLLKSGSEGANMGVQAYDILLGPNSIKKQIGRAEASIIDQGVTAFSAVANQRKNARYEMEAMVRPYRDSYLEYYNNRNIG